jgi:hypothetical protein
MDLGLFKYYSVNSSQSCDLIEQNSAFVDWFHNEVQQIDYVIIFVLIQVTQKSFLYIPIYQVILSIHHI